MIPCSHLLTGNDGLRPNLGLLCSGFAIVKLGTDKQTAEEWAIKIMALPEENTKPTDNENTR